MFEALFKIADALATSLKVALTFFVFVLVAYSFLPVVALDAIAWIASFLVASFSGNREKIKAALAQSSTQRPSWLSLMGWLLVLDLIQWARQERFPWHYGKIATFHEWVFKGYEKRSSALLEVVALYGIGALIYATLTFLSIIQFVHIGFYWTQLSWAAATVLILVKLIHENYKAVKGLINNTQRISTE